jgi:phage-related protein
MATFPSYRPLYPASKRTTPKTRRVAFGDGYEQRLTFGLHQRPDTWTLKWDLLDADANVLEAFLQARADDAASFTWTPPELGATAGQWVCDGDWSREHHEFNRSRIEATFRQVFEP